LKAKLTHSYTNSTLQPGGEIDMDCRSVNWQTHWWN